MKTMMKKAIAVCLTVLTMLSMCTFGIIASADACDEHVFDEGVMIVEPDCKNPGKRIYNCINCDAVKTELTLPKGHIYDVNYLVIKEEGATCVVKGTRSYTLTCPVCEDTLLYLTEKYTIDHVWEKIETLVYPDCYNGGVDLYGCQNCNATHTRNTEKKHLALKGTGEWEVCEDYCYSAYCYECGKMGSLCFSASHDFKTYDVIKEATCTEDGLVYVDCNKQSCDYYGGGYLTISALGHDYVWENDVLPDCCMIAKQGGCVCSLCGDVYTEAIYSDEYFEHNFKIEILAVADGVNRGKTLYTCQNETWSSMYHVYTVEYSLSDIIPGASGDGKFTVNTDKLGTIENIREITGLYEENITFEMVNSDNVTLDENGNLVVNDNGSVTILVKSPIWEAEIEIEVKICDSLDIIADETVETGRVLEFDVVKNPGGIKAENVNWTSSDESIVFVSNGRLIAIGTGKVTLTATVDGLTVSKEINFVAPSNAKKIKFVAIDKMHYIVEDFYAVYNMDTLYWSNEGAMRFRVRAYDTFPFETFIVYVNGNAVEADADGYYYVSADTDEVRVTVSGAMYEEDEGGKINFWQALVNFFKKILSFFGIK